MKRKRNNISALDDLDMVVEQRPYTEEDRRFVSEYLRTEREKQQQQELRREVRKKQRKVKQLA